MRTWVAALLLAAAAAAAADPAMRVIDLDEPDVVAALRKSNRQHLWKLRLLLDEHMVRERTSVEQIVRTAGATDVHTGPMIKTVHPPQASMSFRLDNTRYVIRVRLDGARAIWVQ